MRIPAERIEEMADMLREIPGVTHNYLRDHDFNMWFALIAENREKLDAEIERIRGSGIPEKLISLPKTRKFKIHLALDPKSEDDSAPDVRKDAKAGGAL
jgi:DNA-binding Lrp family transcriptional regulator